MVFAWNFISWNPEYWDFGFSGIWHEVLWIFSVLGLAAAMEQRPGTDDFVIKS
jgi:hypothetical protein